MDIQRSIGADIIMAFDECTPYPCEYGYARQSMELTHRWLSRCVAHHDSHLPLYEHRQSLFPIVQGSTYKDLRMASAEFIANMGCDGNAIGGLSVGEPDEMMYEMCELVCNILPADKPRYLMGVGTPANILENIALGIDMFDCVMPTRNGRNGMLFTTEGIINIKNKKWENDFSVVDPGLSSFASKNYSKAYLRHLFAAGELLGLQLASIQNLSFYLHLVGEARKHILAGTFSDWKPGAIKKYMQRL
jgi:queuine tRNA-ribosyltransferase